MSSGNSLSMPPKAVAAEATLSPVTPRAPATPGGSPRDEEAMQREKLLGKVAHLLNRSISRPQEGSMSHYSDPRASEMTATPTSTSTIIERVRSTTPWSDSSAANHVKETKHVSLEYDPSSKRKVLNTYEILREIGRGEHGKVKLAKNLVNNELVAIKIVSRKSKDRSLRMRRPSNLPPTQQYMNDYEAKIKREIAIMKRCVHKHIVKFKEVLDDRNSYKIYLVLEYMDRGEIMWKRPTPITTPRPVDSSTVSDKIPCWSGNRRPSMTMHSFSLATEDNDLLSNEFSPNLTFRQSRRIFRDVLLGLEYLHMQGIVHRDIKPANLLVSSDYTVKISDFGVSFASSLGSTDDGIYFSDMELAKTVGTPAFFAPELCQTSIVDQNSASDVSESFNSLDLTPSSTNKESSSLPKVDHKIDIWAMGVTLYCLLFGRVPFNADSEFALFDVIVNEELQFPESRHSFFSPQEVSEEEFELAKDLLRKMLQKNSRKRIDIEEIKQHEFVIMDLENEPDRLNEFYFLNSGYAELDSAIADFDYKDRSQNYSPAVGVAKRVGGSLLRAFDNESGSSIATSPVNVMSDDTQIPTEASKQSDKSRSSKSIRENIDGLGLSSSPLRVEQKSHPSTPPGPNSAQWSPKFTQGPFSSQSPHASNSSPVSQPPRKGSIALSNSLLQDVMDFGSNIRRDSSSSQEAPQIETKRNVGGDLYLKNQSAIDAFKDIQKSDKKRRKSSIFATLNRSSSLSGGGKQGKTTEDSTSQTQYAAPIPISPNIESSSKIKVGPISIDSNRRPSSVISLPLTESFASLDSFNDEYLTSKYQEFRNKKQAMRLLNDNVTQSDSALAKEMESSQGINEKFKNFNLGISMSKEGKKSDYQRGSIQDEIAPREPKKTFISLHDSSDSNSCSSESSCSSSSSSESEEEGNLTLKFTPKVAPRSRPPFLSLSNRALSHESNLTDLAHSPRNNYYTPYSFQGPIHELEDVPESLMGGDTVSSLPEVDTNPPKCMPPTLIKNDPLKSKIVQNNPVQSSPLRIEIVGTPDSSKSDAVMQVALDEHISRKASEDRTSTINDGYFNNHYKKEHVRYPLPFSKHLDTDRESHSKQKERGSLGLERQPSYHRSNSITLGFLQHESSDDE
ncbi:hypothetical protein JCM33374_g2569 [Metschnikowia sp. JCM 33374]|nr:hypothetical protein JCM33374_g2569 [Metschnikowia sp. JCM 33374]